MKSRGCREGNKKTKLSRYKVRWNVMHYVWLIIKYHRFFPWGTSLTLIYFLEFAPFSSSENKTPKHPTGINVVLSFHNLKASTFTACPLDPMGQCVWLKMFNTAGGGQKNGTILAHLMPGITQVVDSVWLRNPSFYPTTPIHPPPSHPPSSRILICIYPSLWKEIPEHQTGWLNW